MAPLGRAEQSAMFCGARVDMKEIVIHCNRGSLFL